MVIPGGFALAYNLKQGLEEQSIEPMKVVLMGEYEDDEEPAHQQMRVLVGEELHQGV